MKLCKSNVPPEIVSAPVVRSRLAAVICRVPALTFVPPLKVFAALRTILPEPVLLNAPVPPIAVLAAYVCPESI